MRHPGNSRGEAWATSQPASRPGECIKRRYMSVAVLLLCSELLLTVIHVVRLFNVLVGPTHQSNQSRAPSPQNIQFVFILAGKDFDYMQHRILILPLLLLLLLTAEWMALLIVLH